MTSDSCSTGGAKRRVYKKKVATKKPTKKVAKKPTKKVASKKRVTNNQNNNQNNQNNQNGGFDTNFVAALSILAAKLVADSNTGVKKMPYTGKSSRSPRKSPRPSSPRAASRRRRSNNNNN